MCFFDLSFAHIFSVFHFEKYCPLTRNDRATKLLIADLGRVVALTTGKLLFKVTFFPRTTTLELELFNFVLFHHTKFEFSFFFTSQCFSLLLFTVN